MSAIRVLIALALFIAYVAASPDQTYPVETELKTNSLQAYPYRYPVQSEHDRAKRFHPVLALGALGLGAAGLFGAGIAAGGIAHHALAYHHPYSYGGYGGSYGGYGYHHYHGYY